MENPWKPYFLMNDLGLFSSLFLETPILQTQTMHYYKVNSCKFFKLTTSWHCLMPRKWETSIKKWSHFRYLFGFEEIQQHPPST